MSPWRDDEFDGEECPEIGGAIRTILQSLGEDPARQGLQRTPVRVSRALKFLTSGYDQDIVEVMNEAIFEEDSEEMVMVRDIELYSLCEHHMLPFVGKAHVAYLPSGRIVGLSKIPRVVDVFARRLQVQERLTRQVAHTLNEQLRPRGVAVVIEAAHFCMMMRGVQKQNSTTITSCMLGDFQGAGSQSRAEFLQYLRTSTLSG